MSKHIMDTQELSEIKKLIGNDPKISRTADAFDVDEILQETSKAPQVTPPHPSEEPAAPSNSTPPQNAKKPRLHIVEIPNPHDTPAASAPQALPNNVVPLPRTQHAPTPAAAKPVTPPTPQPSAWEEEPQWDARALKKAEKAERRAQKKAEKQARRAALVQEEQEIYVPCDPRVAARATARRIRSLGGRGVLVFLLGAAAVYLSIAGGAGLPLPAVANFSQQPFMAVLVLILLQFFAMLIGIDIIGMGIYALFRGTPDRKTLLTLTCLATLAHACITIFVPNWDQVLPYCSVSILLLFATMQEEKGRLAARHFTVKAAMLQSQPTGIYCHADKPENVRRITKVPQEDCNGFLTELEKPDMPQTLAFIYAPIAITSCLIFALVSTVGMGAPSRFFWGLSVLLSLASPLGILFGVGKAHSRVAKHLLKEGAALGSIHGARALCRARQVVFDDVDLFPLGSVSIQGLRNYGKYDNEKLLAYVAAVTSMAGLGIGRIFSEKLREQYGRPVRASDLLRYDSGGLSADIGPDSVMVGTAAFLTRLGVRIPDMTGVENGVFVVINNQVGGAFTLSYHPTAQTYSALHGLRRRMHPLLLVRDFNITAAMAESLFELRSGSIEELAGERMELVCDPMYVKNDAVCAILSRDGITPYAEVIRYADKLSRTVRIRMGIGVLAGVCGVLIGFYLVHSYSLVALSPKNVLLYLMLWYLPVFLSGFGTRK